MIVNDPRNETSQSSGRAFSHVDSLEKQIRYGAQFKTFKYAVPLRTMFGSTFEQLIKHETENEKIPIASRKETEVNRCMYQCHNTACTSWKKHS